MPAAGLLLVDFIFIVLNSEKERSPESRIRKSIHLDLTKQNGIQLLKQVNLGPIKSIASEAISWCGERFH